MIKIEKSAESTGAGACHALLTHAVLSLAPGETSSGAPPAVPVEIFTLPLAGTLAPASSLRNLLSPGMTWLDSAGVVSNPSDSNPARLLQLQLRSTPAIAAPRPRSGKFSESERDNILCLLASPDARFGSLPIHSAVQIYTGHLGPGHQITYRIRPDHKLWIRPLTGSLVLSQHHHLSGEHFATISEEPLVTIAATSDSEFILLDLP